MLVTARHVAQAVAAMRGGVEVVGFMARPKGVERKPIRNRIWLSDGEKDDDLAVLDLTDEVEHSAIDLDGDERVKFTTSVQFEGLDDEKTILLLTGTSWMHCLANKEVVIVYPRKYDDKRSLFLALSNAMVK